MAAKKTINVYIVLFTLPLTYLNYTVLKKLSLKTQPSFFFLKDVSFHNYINSCEKFISDEHIFVNQYVHKCG